MDSVFDPDLNCYLLIGFHHQNNNSIYDACACACACVNDDSIDETNPQIHTSGPVVGVGIKAGSGSDLHS